MIFIARMYQARITITKIGNATKLTAFTFDNNNGLEESFCAIEHHLAEMHEKKLASQKQTTPLMLDSAIGSNLTFCKKHLKAIDKRIQLADEIKMLKNYVQCGHYIDQCGNDSQCRASES
jgi:hypothetical protein